jgi:hypothetical protein
MITIAYVKAGPYVQNGMPAPCFPQTCPALGYFVIIGLVGFFVALWGFAQTFLGFLIREGAVEYKPGPVEPPKPGSGPEDENILSMARDLQRQVKRPKFGEITSLAWSEYQPWYGAGWKRRSIRKPFILLLAADLQGRLGAEEWKTLLTYYFLGLKPRLRLLLRFVGPFIVTLFLLILVGLLVSLEYGLQISRLYGQFVASPIILIGLILLFGTAKRVALRWDKWVAGLMNQRALLEVFEKIDSFQLPRVENAKRRHGWLARLWPMPNITERIRNLTDE